MRTAASGRPHVGEQALLVGGHAERRAGHEIAANRLGARRAELVRVTGARPRFDRLRRLATHAARSVRDTEPPGHAVATARTAQAAGADPHYCVTHARHPHPAPTQCRGASARLHPHTHVTAARRSERLAAPARRCGIRAGDPANSAMRSSSLGHAKRRLTGHISIGSPLRKRMWLVSTRCSTGSYVPTSKYTSSGLIVMTSLCLPRTKRVQVGHERLDHEAAARTQRTSHIREGAHLLALAEVGKERVEHHIARRRSRTRAGSRRPSSRSPPGCPRHPAWPASAPPSLRRHRYRAPRRRAPRAGWRRARCRFRARACGRSARRPRGSRPSHSHPTRQRVRSTWVS